MLLFNDVVSEVHFDIYLITYEVSGEGNGNPLLENPMDRGA